MNERSDRYNIIFSDNNTDYTNNERQDAVLEVANTLASSLIEKLVNDTMNTLESETKSDDTELDVAEDAESTDKEVVAKADDTQATAAAEEDTKPEEE